MRPTSLVRPQPCPRWLKVIFGLALTPALLAPFPSSVQARNQQVVTCDTYSRFRLAAPRNSAKLWILDRPARDARLAGEVKAGSTVLVNLSDRSGFYSEITAPGRVTGWVQSYALSPMPNETTQFNGFLQVKTLDGGRVNVRESASPQSKIIGKLASGNVVRYGSNEGSWSYVTDSNGTSGYIANQYLVCTTARFNLRNGPDKN
jgi:uncharacterized protein YgiM (DUF1202 family)